MHLGFTRLQIVATALSLAALGSLGWLPMVAIAAMQIGGGVAVLESTWRLFLCP